MMCEMGEGGEKHTTAVTVDFLVKPAVLLVIIVIVRGKLAENPMMRQYPMKRDQMWSASICRIMMVPIKAMVVLNVIQ
jgi:hypothetical protein